MVGSGLRSQHLLADDSLIVLTSAIVAGSNDPGREFTFGESFTLFGV